MLRKLLKHEFRATARIMGPLYLAMLALSLCGNLSVRLLDASDSRTLRIMGGLILTAFVFVVIGVCVMSVVLMVNRFRTNLMSNEGYVMFTLPVSVHQLIWSKLIVSAVWFLATFLAVGLSVLAVTFRVAYVSDFFSWLSLLFQQLTAYYAVNGVAFLLEAVALFFFGCAAVCLLFYASLAVGYSFAGHKALLSVVFFFLFQFAAQTAGVFLVLALSGFDIPWNPGPVAAIHAVMVFSTACVLAYGAVFYVVTALMLKNRLNLE